MFITLRDLMSADNRIVAKCMRRALFDLPPVVRNVIILRYELQNVAQTQDEADGKNPRSPKVSVEAARRAFGVALEAELVDALNENPGNAPALRPAIEVVRGLRRPRREIVIDIEPPERAMNIRTSKPTKRPKD